MAETDAGHTPSLNPAEWLDRHGDYLYRFAVSRLRDADAAEEVVQETFLAALKSQEQYSGRGSEKAWLATILHRKVIDYVRRRVKREATGGETGEITELLFDQRGNWREDPRIFGPRPAEALEKQEFWQVFRRCLRRLPTRQADVFFLREMDGVTSRDICKELEISSSNLWVLLHRARLGLAACMKKRWATSQSRQ